MRLDLALISSVGPVSNMNRKNRLLFSTRQLYLSSSLVDIKTFKVGLIVKKTTILQQSFVIKDFTLN